MSNIGHYLEQMREMAEACNKLNHVEQGRYPYSCQADFVLQHGHNWTAIPFPQGRFKLRRGRMKRCFQNAFNWAQEFPQDLTYVEGYACRIIPIHHAWCVDRDGNVIDPTWKNQQDCEYFGVPFSLKFVRDTILRTRMYTSMIDNYFEGHPLLMGTQKIEDALVAPVVLVDMKITPTGRAKIAKALEKSA